MDAKLSHLIIHASRGRLSSAAGLKVRLAASERITGRGVRTGRNALARLNAGRYITCIKSRGRSAKARRGDDRARWGHKPLDRACRPPAPLTLRHARRGPQASRRGRPSAGEGSEQRRIEVPTWGYRGGSRSGHAVVAAMHRPEVARAPALRSGRPRPSASVG